MFRILPSLPQLWNHFAQKPKRSARAISPYCGQSQPERLAREVLAAELTKPLMTETVETLRLLPKAISGQMSQ